MRTPDWKLERYLLGELEPEELARIKAEAEADETVRARLEVLRHSNEQIRERYPAAWMTRRIRNRLSATTVGETQVERGRPAGFWRRSLVPAGALGVILLMLVVGPGLLNRNGGDRESPSGFSTERIKGPGPALQLHRKTEVGSERLADSALVREHDLVMIRYQPAGRVHGAILSIDGRGAVTLHLPPEGHKSVGLPSKAVVSLGFAYELDDAPHGEKFFFITSDAPFDLDPIVRTAESKRLEPRAMGDGGLPDSLNLAEGLDQTIFTLKKEAGHE